MIFIRHGEKQYKNANSTFDKHDPGLTEIGIERAKAVADKLIKLYGEPYKIICSPYRRTRETALIMNMQLKNPCEQIIIDTNLSEYLGNHPTAKLDVTTATAVHNPPHPETFEDMKNRAKKSLYKLRKFVANHPNKIIWIITHGLIIKQISNFIGFHIYKNLPYLSGLLIQEENNLLRGTILLFQGDLKANMDESNEYHEKNMKNYEKNYEKK